MMNTMILDDCLQNLLYAQEAMKELIPMTEYELIFEAAENPETAEKVAKNEATAKKSVGFVRKAIDAVIEMIKRVFEAIGDFINRCTMKGDEREAFMAFKEAMRKDPSLKNKKITVRDFRKINKEYDNILAEIDQNIRALKSNENHPIEELTKKVGDFLKNTTGAVTATVGAELAIKMADSNIDAAKGLRLLLKQDTGILESLSKSLGKKNTEKLQKEINAAAKRTILHRLKVKVFRHKYDTLGDCVSSVISACTHAGFRDISEIKSDMKQLKKDYKDGKITRNQYELLLNSYKGEKEKAKENMKSSMNLDAKVLANENLAPIAKSAVSAAVKGAIDAKKDKIKQKRDDKRKAKKTEKSFVDFVTGK